MVGGDNPDSPGGTRRRNGSEGLPALAACAFLGAFSSSFAQYAMDARSREAAAALVAVEAPSRVLHLPEALTGDGPAQEAVDAGIRPSREAVEEPAPVRRQRIRRRRVPSSTPRRR
jgi:hypothetical protein